MGLAQLLVRRLDAQLRHLWAERAGARRARATELGEVPEGGRWGRFLVKGVGWGEWAADAVGDGEWYRCDNQAFVVGIYLFYL